MAPTTESIPGDVAEDILSRLPIRSLIRFKSVSKSFHALLSDHSFARRLYHRSTSHNDGTQFLLLAPHINQAFAIASRPLYQPSNPQSLTVSDFNFPQKHTVQVIGSGDGLICIYLEWIGVALWNPSTRQLRMLPDLGYVPHIGGIRYDPEIDDYKVVVLFGNNFATFQLKGDCWKIVSCHTRLDTFRFGCGHPQCSPRATEPINGAIHWITSPVCPQRDSSLSDFHVEDFVIYSFDLAEERLTQIPPPTCIVWEVQEEHLQYESSPEKSWSIREFELGVLNGCLCLVYVRTWDDDRRNGYHQPPNKSSSFRVDHVWIMEEYGVQESWREVWESGSMFSSGGDRIYACVDGSWRGYMLHTGKELRRGEPIYVQYEGCDAPCISWITRVMKYSESIISPLVYS